MPKLKATPKLTPPQSLALRMMTIGRGTMRKIPRHPRAEGIFDYRLHHFLFGDSEIVWPDKRVVNNLIEKGLLEVL